MPVAHVPGGSIRLPRTAEFRQSRTRVRVRREIRPWRAPNVARAREPRVSPRGTSTHWMTTSRRRSDRKIRRKRCVSASPRPDPLYLYNSFRATLSVKPRGRDAVASLASPPRLGLASARPRGSVPRDFNALLASTRRPARRGRLGSPTSARRSDLAVNELSFRPARSKKTFLRPHGSAGILRLVFGRRLTHPAPIVFLADGASPLRRRTHARAHVLTFSLAAAHASLRTRPRAPLNRHRPPLPPLRRN